MVLVRLVSMIDIASPAPLSPLPTLGAPVLPPPTTPAAPATPSVRRRRALPIALGAFAVLGVAGTVTGFAGKASSESHNSELARTNSNLSADLDDADAEILRLDGQVGDAERTITELEGDLTDSSAKVLTLQRDLAVARAELDAAKASSDLSTIDLPSLNDGVVSPGEAELIAEQASSFGLGEVTIDPARYQDIADRACAADSTRELDGVVDWLRDGETQLSLDAATYVVASAGSAACQSHLYDVIGV